MNEDTPADTSSAHILKDTGVKEPSLLDVPTNIEVPQVSMKQSVEEKTASGSSKIKRYSNLAK